MQAKQTVLAFLAAAAIAARGDITPSGDTSGASDITTIQSAIDAAMNVEGADIFTYGEAKGTKARSGVIIIVE